MFNFIRIFLVLIMILVGFTQLATARLSDPGDIDFFMEPSESDLESQVAGGIIRNLAQCEAYFGGPSRHCEAFLASINSMTAEECMQQFGNSPMCQDLAMRPMTADECMQQFGNSPMCQDLASIRGMTAAECLALFGNSPMCENLANLDISDDEGGLLANRYGSRKQCLRFNPGQLSFCSGFGSTRRLSQQENTPTIIPVSNPQSTSETVTDI